MLKIGILYEDGSKKLVFSQEKFQKLLKEYFNKTKSTDKAIEMIVEDIKKLSINKK